MYVLVRQNNYISCSYELFQLITEKHRSKATTKKNYTKAYYIILYIYYVDMLISNLTKLYFIFYDFSVIYYDFFKYLAKINKKKKTKLL